MAMNKKEIEELIKFVSKAGVSEVSLEMKDIKITIKNSAPQRLDQVVSHVAVEPICPGKSSPEQRRPQTIRVKRAPPPCQSLPRIR